MPRFPRFAIALLIMVALGFTVSGAAAAGNVSVRLTANRVTKIDGREVLIPAAQAHPGETLEYRAVYRNEGAGSARDVAATLPIPRGTSYLRGSAEPSTVEASLDGHTFAPVPLLRRVREPDGRSVLREVPVSEYTALRWPLGSLSARQARAVRARVRIQPVEVAALTH